MKIVSLLDLLLVVVVKSISGYAIGDMLIQLILEISSNGIVIKTDLSQ